MNGWRVAWAIAAKDLRIERRSRTSLMTALLFVVLVQVIVVLSRDAGAVSLGALAPGVLWVTLALASLMVLSRVFLLERDDAAGEVLLLAPISRHTLFCGKWLGNIVLVGVVACCAFPVWILFFNVPVGAALLGVLALLALTTIGVSAVGTLFAALAVRTRVAELLMPVLLLPAMLPPVSFAARITVRLLEGRPWSELAGDFAFLACFDLGYLLLAMLLFPTVVDE